MIKAMKTRGELLKERRKELGLTLREVSESIGISLPGVQNLEKGDVMPSLAIGVAIAKCYRKPVQWVLHGTEADPDRVPIIGTTDTGPNEKWKPGELPPTDRFLPMVSQRRSVYALNIAAVDAPGYNTGDLLLVDSQMEPVPGEDVLVCDVEGKTSVMRLARVDGDAYYLDLPTLQRAIYNKSDLKYVHQIVGTIKSFMKEGL